MKTDFCFNNTGMWLIAALILFLPSQTAFGWGKSYGILKQSSEVNGIFIAHKILPDHKYYYSGPDDVPKALIGIDNNYTLDSKLWKPVDLTPELLKKWFRSWFNFRDQPAINWGADILDPNGKKVGIWFSRQNRTTVKMLGNNRVQVHTPKLDSRACK